MLNKIYGIDYNTYVCGGIGWGKLAFECSKTILFYSEEEMLKCLADLKKNCCCGEIKVFESRINRMEYKI